MDEFVNNLKGSPWVESVEVPLRTPSDQQSWTYEYELRIYLKKPIKLQ